MSKRGVGLLLILTAAIALGALAQDYRFDGLIASEQTSALSFDQHVRDLEHVVVTLDGSRRTALASGQTLEDWVDRSGQALNDAGAAILAERTATNDAPTIAALDAASASMEKLRKSDGSGAAQETHEALTTARTANRRRADASLQQLGRVRLAMNAIAVIFTLAVAIYLGRVATTLGVKGAASTAQMLRDLPPPVKTGALTPVVTPLAVPATISMPATSIMPATSASSPPASVVPAPLATPAPSATPPPAPAPQRPSANLAAAAELCVDLAKVVDADDVPSLLERTAMVLDARGIVVWAIDSDGARLRASLSHGYPDKVLAKLRPLQIDADNVTSLACRSLQPQMVNGALADDPAALAIPLLTGSGCVGVMSVELRQNRPHADLLPVARILGAQFSTLIAPTQELAQTGVR
jgi:hypothetical protein